MHAGKQTNMKPGAIWACAIPVTLGVIGGLVLIGIELPAGRDTRDALFLMGGFLLCFVMSAPLSAWLACSRLAQTNSANTLSLWKTSAKQGLLSSSLVHFLMTILYTTGFIIIVFGKSQTSVGQMVGVYVVAVMYNLMIWLFLTLPLTLLCATIFWKVTKFPEDTSVF